MIVSSQAFWRVGMDAVEWSAGPVGLKCGRWLLFSGYLMSVCELGFRALRPCGVDGRGSGRRG